MSILLASGNTKPQYPYDQWYGIQGDFSSNDYKLTRVGNLDLHRACPIQTRLRRFVENPDGSVKYYLHQNDSRKKESGADAVIDSTDGNVMLEIPEYFMKLEIEGTKWLMAFSEYPLPGFQRMIRKTISPWFATIDMENQKAVSGCWLLWDGNEIKRDSNGIVQLAANAANFRGGTGSSDASKDGTYNSQLGMPRTSIAKSTVRGYCVDGTHIGAFSAYNQIAWLQRLEYASLNCQAEYVATLTEDGYHQGGLGTGQAVDSTEWNTWGGYRPFIPCGVTATLGNNTGRVAYTVKGWTGGDKVVYVISYRGLEVPFQYLWLLTDDVLIWHKADKSIAYVCSDPTKFTSHSNNATNVPDGYMSISELPRTSGYILQESLSSKGYSFPEKIGGSSVAGYCDYFYTPVTADTAEDLGWFMALLGGGSHHGAFAGFGSLSSSDRSSSTGAAYGFRLCRF